MLETRGVACGRGLLCALDVGEGARDGELLIARLCPPPLPPPPALRTGVLSLAPDGLASGEPLTAAVASAIVLIDRTRLAADDDGDGRGEELLAPPEEAPPPFACSAAALP